MKEKDYLRDRFTGPNMLNRSLSLSEFPVTNRINTEEHMPQSAGQFLFKHYSCEQIEYGSEKVKIERVVQEFSVSQDNVASWKSWGMKFEGPLSLMNETSDNINPCSSTTSKIEENNVEIANTKAIIRPLCPSSSKPLPQKRKISVLFVLLPIVFLFAAVVASCSLFFASYQRLCEKKLDVGAMKSALESSLFGQGDAIEEIVAILHIFNSVIDAGIVIIALFGGTGVGKSYTTTIIREHFPWENNVLHFVLPLHTSELSSADVYGKFSDCGGNLAILDGLVPSETVEVVEFLQTLTKLNKDSGKRVVIVLVFSVEDQKFVLQNCEDCECQLDSSKEKLLSIFQTAGLKASLVPFQALQKEHVIMCIKEAVGQKGVLWSDAEIDQVLALLPRDTGCKGVSSKVQLVLSSGTSSNVV